MGTLMKKLTILFVFLLASCSTFIVPIKHDPGQVEVYISLKDKLEELDCQARKENAILWDKAMAKAHRLWLYSDFRQDPQTENVKEIEGSLFKAYHGSLGFCEAKLRMIDISMDIIAKAWRGRE